MTILSVPVENGLGKTKGTSEAPEAILAELKSFAERSVDERGLPLEFSSERLELDLSNLEEANSRIVERCSALFGKQKQEVIQRPLVLLGGDHSLTYASFKAFRKHYPKAGLLVLDAHPDMMHALNPPTHEDYLLTLLSEDILIPSRVVLLGLRSMHQVELERLQKLRIRHFTMREISRESLREVVDSAMIAARQWEAVYLSIDIDVLDPAFAPGTGYPEPGGLTSRELLYALGRLRMLDSIKAVDLVEVNPRLDRSGQTVRLAARILAELR